MQNLLGLLVVVQDSLTVVITVLHLLRQLLVNVKGKGSNAAEVSICLCFICSLPVHIWYVRFSELKPSSFEPENIREHRSFPQMPRLSCRAENVILFWVYSC